MKEQSPHNEPHFTWNDAFYDEKSLEESFRFDDTGREISSREDFHLVTIRPGFSIYTSRLEPRKTPSWDLQVAFAPLCFSFCLGGKIGVHWQRGKLADSITLERGANSFFWLDQVTGHSQHLSPETAYFVAILLQPEILADYLGEEMEHIPESFARILNKKTAFANFTMTPKMILTAAQAFEHSDCGCAARLHLESCGLSLLAQQIEQLAKTELRPARPLCSSDEERIRAAADILVRNMANPPGISSLARQVGVNESKLKRGFRQMFDSTVIQFLSAQRMIRARVLLSQGMDVSETAFSVGYNSVSHFILCYRKTFGVTPGFHKHNDRLF
ncbi:MAG: hypothetical protein CSA26_10440 [Desulfobacterales bacterium]|nr:MAG: hypothetical protein CSA26_10440 [Desulfobacterales bacterium]